MRMQTYKRTIHSASNESKQPIPIQQIQAKKFNKGRNHSPLYDLTLAGGWVFGFPSTGGNPGLENVGTLGKSNLTGGVTCSPPVVSAPMIFNPDKEVNDF